MNNNTNSRKSQSMQLKFNIVEKILNTRYYIQNTNYCWARSRAVEQSA